MKRTRQGEHPPTYYLCKLLLDVVSKLWVVGEEELANGILTSRRQLGEAVVLDHAHEKVMGDCAQNASTITWGVGGNECVYHTHHLRVPRSPDHGL